MKKYLCLTVFFAFYLGALLPGDMVCAMASSAQPIRATIQSASELDYPPFALVKDDGTAGGFSVELLKAACERVGLMVDFKVGPWGEIKDELKRGELDALPLVSYSKERDAYFDFSAPYLRMHGTIFVREGNTSIRSEADLKDKEIIVMRGDTAHEYAVRNHLSDKLILTESFEDAMKRLSDGEHDAVIVQQLVGWQLIDRLGLENVVDVERTLNTDISLTSKPLMGFEQKFSFAVHEGNAHLLSQLNEGLAITFSDGTYNTLYNKWFGPLIPGAAISAEEIVKISLYTLIPACLLFSLIGLIVLRRRVRQKTAHLVEEVEKRKDIEGQLLVSNERYQTLINHCGEGLVLIQDGVFKFVNPRYCKMMNFSEGDLLGRAYLSVIHSEDRELVQEWIRQTASEALEGEYEVRILTADGSVRWHQFSRTNIVWEGAPAILFFVQDVTDRHEAVEDIIKARKKRIRPTGPSRCSWRI